MPKLSWTCYNETKTVGFTNNVISLSMREGREKYLDTYSGGSCVITINNYNNIADTFTYGDKISVYNGLGPDYLSFTFWVQEVRFEDTAGAQGATATGINRATITCADFMSRAGRVNANNLSLAQNTTWQQANLFNQSAGGPLPSDMIVGGYAATAGSTAAATTYTGSVNNYLNLLVVTERGYFIQRAYSLIFVTRTDAASLVPIATTLGRTTSATQIAYQDFERIQNGLQFINTATISPNGLTAQTSTNAAAVTAYGPAFYSSSTVDVSTTQASGNADWIVNTFNDPAALRFVCTLNDVMQDATALTSWVTQFWGLTASRCINLSYTVPGGSPTTVAVIMEGVEINVIPGMTTFRMSFSPLQYYQFFTLDNSALGVLDTSRLGW